jgi:hypothetical protein
MAPTEFGNFRFGLNGLKAKLELYRPIRLVNAVPINLEFMGTQFPDIMADSIDAKQMLVTLNSKLD